MESIQSKIKQNIPLAPLTTFKVGGSAKFFLEVESKEDLLGAYEWAKEKGEQVAILAGGSNVLINDNGVDGLVVKINNGNAVIKGERMECGAGASLISIARLSASHGLSGTEWAIGIPGTVGGAVRGNAGAYGSSISESVETAEVFNAKKEKFEQFSQKDCKFNYRESIFKKDNAKHLLIWQVVLRLRKGGIAEIQSLLDKYLTHREKNQPKLPSAGCVFKNLTIDELRNFNFDLANEAMGADIIKGGKIGAGWIVDKAGLKGKAIGGAKVSLEHANFIINTGKATAEDIIMLISFIKQQVRTKYNVQLQEEIQYFGF
ncbi:UDP-N-acetylmuramate dehydrogenase [Candidatus Parcubacteria bacterium]|nr:UDP-N-acetylmuramate dehydrogenase [Candidatus Parcubacteria bacterium]